MDCSGFQSVHAAINLGMDIVNLAPKSLFPDSLVAFCLAVRKAKVLPAWKQEDGLTSVKADLESPGCVLLSRCPLRSCKESQESRSRNVDSIFLRTFVSSNKSWKIGIAF